ncbi:MAG: DUF72 domain-containing protein [Acidobacteria bacterium]|jgi:uncharacterized protein YecE (DUF72 family)|nr:MAG: DUF72 domain-containing protein [Acidobacteriota bacterium]
MPARLWIGTSGWHYRHWREVFYPEKMSSAKMLAHYAQEFDTVEINNTFYRLPEKQTFADWAATAPSGFRFAVKASRFITHIKRLRDPEEPIDRLFSRAIALGRHFGPVLFQLPPNWKLDEGRLREFLEKSPRDHQCAFEFRDLSWFSRRTYELLREHNAALCVHDLRGQSWPIEVTANFIYLRLHGPTGAYHGKYPRDTLARWAEWIAERAQRARDIYVYFNNDQGGHAITNARELRTMLAECVECVMR